MHDSLGRAESVNAVAKRIKIKEGEKRLFLKQLQLCFMGLNRTHKKKVTRTVGEFETDQKKSFF